MSDTLPEEIRQLHRLYNEVWKLQEYLPLNRPRHSNYADREEAVFQKLREVQAAARRLPSTGPYAADVDNIRAGCEEMLKNPYRRLGGHRDV